MGASLLHKGLVGATLLGVVRRELSHRAKPWKGGLGKAQEKSSVSMKDEEIRREEDKNITSRFGA